MAQGNTQTLRTTNTYAMAVTALMTAGPARRKVRAKKRCAGAATAAARFKQTRNVQNGPFFSAE